MSKRSIRTIYIFFSLLICVNTTVAQTIDYTIYANIIYRFTKYVDWPGNKKAGEFKIGIVGESPVYDELVAFTKSRFVDNQPIVIKTYSANSRFYDCHILFIAEEESGEVKRIAGVTAGQPVLIVTENTGLISRGACINILVIGDHLKLEFSKKNIEKRNLNIASELLQLGSVVN